MTARKSALTLPARLAALVALIGVGISALLVCKHLFPQICSSALGCSVQGGVDGCKELGQSKHSQILGIPIALFGLFYYSLVAGLLWRLSSSSDEDRPGLVNLSLSVIAFGVLADLALGYKNFFVLLYPCMLCAYTYLAQTGLLLGAVWIYVANGKDIGSGLGSGLKSAIIPLALAVIATIAIPLVLLMAGGAGPKDPHAGHDHGHDHGHGHSHGGGDTKVPLIAPERVKSTIGDLRGFAKAGINTAGLTNVEGKGFIEIQKFADFNCGHCYNTSLILKEALKRWPGRVKVIYRHFPLDGTCNPEVKGKRGGSSCNGALASLCAPKFNIFGEVYHGIFDFQRSQKPINAANLQQLVESSGGTWSPFAACMGAGATNAALQRDIRDAVRIKVESTPTLVIQDHILPPGTPDVNFLMQLLDALVYEKEGAKAFAEFAGRKQ